MIRIAMIAAVLTGSLGAAGQSRVEERQAAELAKSLEGLSAGKPTSCINPDQVTYTRKYKDTIVYVQGRSKLWVNRTNAGCDGLIRDDIIVWKSPIHQYCKGDMIQTRSRSGGFFTGACSLGEFVPYTKEKGRN
ncbi:hypothetical protein [Sphingomonas sp.]|uniref:hypothetical protein n=1 Tax=Sphingomonas sp. TaxID=28214 RepID=UPI001B07DDAC|nr:hypothetical protein [Sphingomonas sp.]MBO9713571.1 hypothetical protein [Sphingomonas sp.]